MEWKEAEKEMAYLTINDLKTLLHIGNSAAYKLVQIKSFPAFRVGSGQWLIDSTKLEVWLGNLQKMPDKGTSILEGGRRGL